MPIRLKPKPRDYKVTKGWLLTNVDDLAEARADAVGVQLYKGQKTVRPDEYAIDPLEHRQVRATIWEVIGGIRLDTDYTLVAVDGHYVVCLTEEIGAFRRLYDWYMGR